MKALVTGVAGFIGSHLAEKLLASGHGVVGIDNFLDNYPRHFKENNLVGLAQNPEFTFLSDDLLRVDLERLLRGVSYVFIWPANRGCALVGVESFPAILKTTLWRPSGYWRPPKSRSSPSLSMHRRLRFTAILTTCQCARTAELDRFPYGATKLAAEHLCYLYWKAFGVPTVALRFFTVYGPRQRPDMFFHIFMRALQRGEEVPLYDDGEQTRDFTYCTDIVDGLLNAAFYPGTGEVFNLGGGSQTSVLDAIALVERIAGRKARIKHGDRQKGDVRHTKARLDEAKRKLNYAPKFDLEAGLAAEWEWICSLNA